VEIPALSGLGSLGELAFGMVEGSRIPAQRRAVRGASDGLREALATAGRLSTSRGGGGSALVVLFSDALGEPEDLLRSLESARSAGAAGSAREVAVVRVLTPEEVDGPPMGTQRFVDAALRAGGRAHWGRANTRSALDAYRARMHAHREAVRRGVLAMGGRFVEHRTDEDPARALIKLLESG
ncbi:MAG: hypothetical protein ACNA8P_05060, partial [Phycisphaerales bacterium]